MVDINKVGNESLYHAHVVSLDTKLTVSETPKVVLLATSNPQLSEITPSALTTMAKIILAPVNLLLFLIVKSLSLFAASKGLGKTEEAKRIDLYNRNMLRSMGGEEISFGMEGQAVLEGMFFRADTEGNEHKKQKTILLCTGSHKSYEFYAVPMVRTLLSMGHNVMVFNYEGFGKSQGSISEEGVYRSIESAYQYLKQERKCSDGSIVAWGYSLGSGAVSDLAAKHTVDIVIDRGFSTMSEVASSVVPTGLKTIARIVFVVGAHFDNMSKLAKAKGKAFVAQGLYDGTMKKELHGAYLKKAIEQNQQAIYREIDAGHFHSNEVWFEKGEDRQAIESFLSS